MPRAKQPAQSNQTPPSNPTVGNRSTGNGNNTHSRSYADATSGKTPQPSQQSNSKLEDMLLKQKSHTTSRSRINVPGYSVYLTPHPDGGAHAGAAIIIKSVKHCLLDPFAASLSPSYLH
ncbi:hypothetical protein EVAR_103111_1 [Eumeta japonica]|uniref:Uncharacterized protein n=1 Tax=Eumeta variegata TaxID=151549 RepID=A0A4C1X5D2_EUMVA|nr:hypothetical protein EVAR_103111_1 [Eumeta japonica]